MSTPCFDTIWQSHTTGRKDQQFEELTPDLVFGHEATMALILDPLEKADGPRLPPEKLFLVVDHFAPASSGRFADIARDFRLFCNHRNLPYHLHEGIGHRLMLESPRVKSGMLVIGADSHTTTIGGKSALGIGLGSTDVLAVLMTGTVWLEKPAVSRILLQGALPRWVEPKDVVLHLLGTYGQAGFLGEVMEFVDSSDQTLDIEQRSVLTNMCVEMGAVSALVVDADTALTGPVHRTITVELDGLQSLVACPGAPDDVIPVAQAGAVKIDCANLGSCASGGLTDLKVAAAMLSQRTVAQGAALLVTPATRSVFLSANRDGIIDPIVRAGATLLNPSCGACGGIDKGIPGTGDIVVSTAPRNYSARARIGSQVYLASTATTVASAIAGHLVDPAEVMS